MMDTLREKYNDLNFQGRMASIVLRLALVFLLLFPAAFVAIEADHDCSNADCAVCQCIQAAEALLDSMGSGSAAAAIVAAFSLLFIALLFETSYVSNPFTLVQQKVRLDV